MQGPIWQDENARTMFEEVAMVMMNGVQPSIRAMSVLCLFESRCRELLARSRGEASAWRLFALFFGSPHGPQMTWRKEKL